MVGIQYMVGSYDLRLAVLAGVVAILASYAALDLVGRVHAAAASRAHAWLAAGAIAMGTGIWSMHFIAMLAFELPIRMGYDVWMTAGSWLLAVAASALALAVAAGRKLCWFRLTIGAGAMAASIAGMHYLGMAAMRMQPGIVYDPFWVALSLCIAFAASAAALRIAYHLRELKSLRAVAAKGTAAVIMGFAISGMHYAGMAAARFPIDSVCGAVTAIEPLWLAALVGGSTILLLATALTAAALDRRMETRTAQLVRSLSEANSSLQHASRHDPLTNLPNRTFLHERIEQALKGWTSAQQRFAVLYVDLDGFKLLNDQMGHDSGDELLKRVANAMQRVIRRGDMVARIGGDEFVLVLDALPDSAVAAAIGDKLLDAIATVEGGAAPLSASIGSAVCPEDGTTLSELITAADVAMYAAKNRGKNCYQAYERDMASQIADEFHIQQELRDAIRDGDLVVHYQPKYATHDRRLTGAEALVRWQHRERGMIPPDRFIGVAERCGLINDLETRVLDSVCGQVRRWLDCGFDVPPISVNLSPVRIRDEQLPTRTQACLNKYRLDARYLVFEITESLAVREILRAIDALKRFSAMGVHVALDDFGTGHSSLSYLRQLPIQQLKIDRSFINDLGTTDGDHIEIVRSIIGLAHALRLHVVAEGVETEEQMTLLAELDCDEVQGYLLSRPVPPEAFAEIVANAVQHPGSARIHVLPS